MRIVYAWADWHEDSVSMLDAWSDPDVVAWLAEHDVELEVVAHDHEVERVAELAISHVPVTILLADDDRELARTDRAMAADELARWLVDEPVDVGARHDEARALLHAGLASAALPAYLWLWEEALAHDPGFAAVRHSLVVAELRELCGQSDAARATFAALRDRLDPTAGDDALADWCALHRALGESARALAWFEARPGPFHAEHAQLLEEADRWADAGARYDVAHEIRALTQLVGLAPAGHQELRRAAAAPQVARMLRALRAADRPDDAAALEACARTLEIELG